MKKLQITLKPPILTLAQKKRSKAHNESIQTQKIQFDLQFAFEESVAYVGEMVKQGYK